MDSQQPQSPAQTSPVVPPAPAVQPPPPVSTAPTEPTTPSTPPSSKPSHKKLFFGLILIFILLSVGLGLYTLYMTKSAQVMYQDAYKTPPQATATPSPVVENSQVKTGDPQLDQQSVNIDAGLDTLNTDISNVDKGLKDQPVDLSQ